MTPLFLFQICIYHLAESHLPRMEQSLHPEQLQSFYLTALTIQYTQYATIMTAIATNSPVIFPYTHIEPI